jgi:hypothetical protein
VVRRRWIGLLRDRALVEPRGREHFYESWGIADEPGEEGWRLEGDIGLVALG